MDLEAFIKAVFKENDLETISKLLKQNNANPTPEFVKVMLTTLDKMVNREFDRNAFDHLSTVLLCIQNICKDHLSESVTLIEQGLVSKMALWFDRATEFLETEELASDKSLNVLVEHFYDTVLDVCQYNEGKDRVLDTFLLRFGFLAVCTERGYRLRLEALRTLNSITTLVPREERSTIFYLSDEFCNLTRGLAKSIGPAGDYEIQVGIIEALCRMVKTKERRAIAHEWFEGTLAEAFKEVNSQDFETDSRTFLNILNARLGGKRSVYTFPSVIVYADLDELKKPADDNLKHFWIDFNTGSKSISFLVELVETSVWETVRLAEDALTVYHLTEVDKHHILTINLTCPLKIQGNFITKVKMVFESQYDIETAVELVYSDKKRSNSVSGITEEPIESPAIEKKKLENVIVTSQSSFLDWKNRQPNKDKMDSQSDILSSQISEQSVPAINSSGTTSTQKSPHTMESEDPAVIESVPETTDSPLSPPRVGSDSTSDQCLKTIPTSAAVHEDPSKNGKPERSKKRKSSSENQSDDANGKPMNVSPGSKSVNGDSSKKSTPEGAKRRPSISKSTLKSKNGDGTYDIHHLLEVPSYEKVSEAKLKVLGKSGPSQRSKEGTVTKDTPSIPERKVPGSYREHLFSDTNEEEAESNHSDQSWISEHKKKMRKSMDYSRKKPRTKSAFKVLPLSSPSGSEDEKTNKTGSFLKSTPIKEKGSNIGNGNATSLKFTEGKLQGVSALLTPRDSCLKSPGKHHLADLQADVDLGCVSGPASPSNSDIFVIEPKKKSPFSASLGLHRSGFSKIDEISKFRQDVTDVSFAKSTPSGGEEVRVQTPEMYLWPRKLFISSGKDKKTEEDPKLAEPEDILDLEDQEEDLGDAGVIAAFESFSKDLKERFLTRYQRMEIRAQRTLKASEHHVSTLLKQVHQCRLTKLDNFHAIVVQELDNLDKETQVLRGLEKATMDFWKEQSEKLNAFCNIQHKRLRSVDTTLGDTTKSFTEVMQETVNIEHQMGTTE